MLNTHCTDHVQVGHEEWPLELLELEYYDGPVNGAARCSVCGETFRFDMLDWDDGQIVRVFVLRPLLADRHGAFAELYRQLPRPCGVLASHAVAALYSDMEKALDETGPPEWLIAWDTYSHAVVRRRRLAEQERVSLDFTPLLASGGSIDWLSLLAVPRVVDDDI